MFRPSPFDDNLTTTRTNFLSSAKDAFHRSCRFVTHAGEQVTVGIEGYGDRSVTEEFNC
jgi:hypothetical protein